MDIGSRRRARPLLPAYFGLNKRELERRIVTKRERDNADRLNWQERVTHSVDFSEIN